MSEPLLTTTIAVIGAGTMGHGIAQLFASYGYAVRLTDSQAVIRNGALSRIRKNLHFMADNGFLSGDGYLTGKEHAERREQEIAAILARIIVTETVEAAVSGAAVIVEAIFE